AHQLEKRGALAKLFISGYSKSDKNYIKQSFVCNNNFNNYLDYFFAKFKINKFINKSNYYVFKDNLFDYWLNKQIDKLNKSNINIDIFVGWAHFFLHSIPNIKKTGAKIILESGSCHILEQQKLIQSEYDKFGIKYPAINKKNIDKILCEYEQADYIMTISDFVYKSFLKQNINSKKLLKVTCGIDIEFFETPNSPKSEFSKFKVIFVGLLCLRKGVQYLIQAWQKLNFTPDQAELILVGNLQQDLSLFLKQTKLPKNIIFYGSTDKFNLKKLYQSADLFVLPSIEDGFGMVIGEAMACGLPVICSDHTAATDLIENKVHGFIVPAGNVEILAEKILYVYQNREQAQFMGQLAKGHVQKFSWDNYGENIFKAYKNILTF
ncbi:glycosyltransferase family 4 protein, partial [Candidatus Babeliales bacterium]|nr:glycosyltransferase family 4 protein [Candidatus Babeliales bacterium]